MVNTEGNGKRIKLTTAALREIGDPEAVNVLSDGYRLFITGAIDGGKKSYKLSKGHIYHSGLVERLSETCRIDYNGRTSHSFDDVKVGEVKVEGVIVRAIIVRYRDSDEV